MNAEYVRDLYERFHNREMHIVDRMWESRKYFTSLYTALITVSIVLITWFSQTQDTSPPKALATIPLTAVVLLIIGFLEFRRERTADLEVVATLGKIEVYLGLHRVIEKRRRLFPDDEYLIPTRYVASRKGFKSSNDFIHEYLSLRRLDRSVLQTYVILSSVATILALAILLI